VRDVTLGYRTNVAPWVGWALLVAIGWLAARSWRRSRHGGRSGRERQPEETSAV